MNNTVTRMPHKSKAAQYEYFLEHKEQYKEYGAKYYENNKYEVNRRRLLRRIAAGKTVLPETLTKYKI